MSAEQLVSFFMDCNPDADRDRVLFIASLYIEECFAEGV